ncbi:GrpB family protein [Paenibacillus sp. D2_2]|uniref:GrpB family protein n=1 Tax=Paenibacillus sp. D2_2 TaxID=3073092 RepID=UPI002816361C|nr:GrpB family protein [Paenibacillus sp. D2_2]WMT41771.1 GrpB family protein [Paenibacillus sp. D2_2]
MRQDFSNVTDEQLAQLFPILLEQHNPEWKEYYLEEKDHLESIFGDVIVRISHIGSSAVDGLIAKPTIDILIEVKEDTDILSITETMLDAGYVVNTPESDIIMYLKGYTPRGFRAGCSYSCSLLWRLGRTVFSRLCEYSPRSSGRIC